MESNEIQVLWRFYIDENLISEIKSNSSLISSKKEIIKEGELFIRASRDTLTPDVIIKIFETAVLAGAGKKLGEDIWVELQKIIPVILESLKSEVGYISKRFKKRKLNLVELNRSLKNGINVKFLFSDTDEEKHTEVMLKKAKEILNSEELMYLDTHFENLESHVKSKFLNLQLVWDKKNQDWKELDLSQYIKDGKFIYPN